MPSSSKSVIALVESAYDIHAEPRPWLDRLVESAEELIGDGLGTMGVHGRRQAPGAPPDIAGASGSNELLMMQAMMVRDLPQSTIDRGTETGVAAVIDKYREHPDHVEVFQRHFRTLGAEDALSVTGIDPGGQGIHFFSLQAERRKLDAWDRIRWKMLTAHLSAGLRLRTTLASPGEKAAPPERAEAVIDPNGFKVAEFAGSDGAKHSVEALRESAIQQDKVRAARNQDANELLESWEALVRGRWSMVDWFDTDGRRYVLALPNPPDVTDPRALTERESQVAAYAAIGESHKMIGYRLGISRVRVTNHLRSVMEKLGVKTNAELVHRLRGFSDVPMRDAGE
ncbi:MAG: helix-turn-helix transcriptional regulator [Myxococcota bacterium]